MRGVGAVFRLVGLLVAVVVVIGFAGDAASARVARPRLSLIARLTVPGISEDFASVAMSGQVLVASGFVWPNPPFDDVSPDNQDQSVYLFTRPATGWASETEAAPLADPYSAGSDAFGRQIAVSGDTVVVSASAANGGEEAAYVFTEPPEGWSGVVDPVATLLPTVAGEEFGSSIAISGDTIVVGSTCPNVALSSGACYLQNSPGALYVFSRPAGGWTGTLHEDATLVDPSGGGLGELSVQGNDVYATNAASPGLDRDVVDVFEKPRAGWSGTILPRARLSPSLNLESISASGSIVVAAGTHANAFAVEAVVFKQPRRGWKKITAPVARLRIHSQVNSVDTVISGNTIAALSWFSESDTCTFFPGCPSMLDSFNRPRDGWKGNIAPYASLSTMTTGPYGNQLTAQGQTIATAATAEINIFKRTRN